MAGRWRKFSGARSRGSRVDRAVGWRLSGVVRTPTRHPTPHARHPCPPGARHPIPPNPGGTTLGADAYRVEVLAPSRWDVWERLLSRCPQANPFSRPEWLEPLAQLTDAQVEVAICWRGEEPVAGYAAFVRQSLMGRTARLAPTTPYNTVAIASRSCREPHRVERFELDVLRAIRQHATERY